MAGQFGTVQEIGGLVGRFILAFLAVYIVSRRSLLRVFSTAWPDRRPARIRLRHYREPSPVRSASRGRSHRGDHFISRGHFLRRFVHGGPVSFWGNYLPRVYPLHLRGTGESFAANIGGRMIGTSFAWVTSELSGLNLFSGSDPLRMAYTAASVALFVYLVGSVACFFLPEPKEGVPLD